MTIILLDKIETELLVENGQINNEVPNKMVDTTKCDCIRRNRKEARNV